MRCVLLLTDMLGRVERLVKDDDNRKVHEVV